MATSSLKARARKRTTRGNKRPSEIVANTRKPLWKHQKLTKKLYERTKSVYDLSDPGTGKTRAHLEAFAERRRQGGGKALVIAPKSLLETAWWADAWEFTKDMRCSVAYARNRSAAFNVHADIYITNTDAVKWLKANLKSKHWDDFDTLIMDEITDFKHHTSQRSKAAKWLSSFFTYRIGLTGTPNPKSVTEMWHQVLLLDGGQRLGPSFWNFRSSVQSPKQEGPRPEHVKWYDKEGAEEAVFGLIGDIAIRHIFEECMDIPPNVERHVQFSLAPKVQKMYKKLEASTVLQLEQGDVIGLNAAALRTKLLQVASGAVYIDEDTYEVLDDTRYELITQLIKEQKHSICFYIWKHQKDQLIRLAEREGISYAHLDSTVTRRKDAVKQIVADYQAGKYQVLYLHPKTGAHGLTLTRGTRTIWASPVYQPDFIKQGKHRIYRGGQTHKTETIMVEAKQTAERKVFDILNNDGARMLNFLDIVHAAKETYEDD